VRTASGCLMPIVGLTLLMSGETGAQQPQTSSVDAEQPAASALYAELKTEEGARAGDVDFDYRLGVAADDSGHPLDAVFALQRVLDVDPRHLPARAELARAYAALGEYEAAQSGFALVAAQEGVPEDTREALQRYVQTLETRLAGGGTQVDGFLHVGTGYDSNVNNAMDEERILIPAFSALGLATLDSSALEQEDGFAETTARVSIVHGLGRGRRLLADLSGDFRKNHEQAQFDQSTAGLSLGFAKETLQHGTFTVAAQGQNFRVDGDVFRNAAGVLAGWSTRTSRGKDVAANLQYTALDFPDQPARNAHRTALGRTVGRALSPRTYFFSGFYGGRERADDARFDNLSQWFVGGRVGAEMRRGQRLRVFVNALVELQSFDEDEPLFLEARETVRADLRVGTRIQLSKAVGFTAEVGYTRADSNIALFDFDRVTAALGIEYGF
jgi:hypothetical protein